MITKVCAKCNKELSVDVFGPSKGHKDGYKPTCRVCTAKHHAEWRQRKKDELGENEYAVLRTLEYLSWVNRYGREERNRKSREKYDPEANRVYVKAYKAKRIERDGAMYIEAEKAKKKAYKDASKEKIRQSSREYGLKNKDRLKAKSAQYYQENKDRINARNKEYYYKNTEAHYVRTFNTYARRKSAEGEITFEDVEILRHLQGNKCGYCFVSLDIAPMEIDHKDPISKGGSNLIHNLLLTCKTCNRSKGSRTVAEFLAFNRVVHPKKYDRYVKSATDEMPLYFAWINTQDSLAA